jgi:hypothetical protein
MQLWRDYEDGATRIAAKRGTQLALFQVRPRRYFLRCDSGNRSIA